MPPDIPAAKLRPVGPITTTLPPVMYSQPWSPTPSTTAVAPLLRTAKRSPPPPRVEARADPLARQAADVGAAVGRAVQGDVADDDVLLGRERGVLGREHVDLAARE